MNEHERVWNTVDEPERKPSDRRRFLLGLVAAGLAYATPTLLGLDEAGAEPWERRSNRRHTRRTRPSNRRRTRRTRPSRRRPDHTRPRRTRPSRHRPDRTRPGRTRPSRRHDRPGPYGSYRTRPSRRGDRPDNGNRRFQGFNHERRRPDGPRRDI